MIGVWLVETALATLVGWIVATQVLVPFVTGTRLFPAVRHRVGSERELQKLLKRLNEEAAAQAVEDEFTARKEALRRHRELLQQDDNNDDKGESDGDDKTV